MLYNFAAIDFQTATEQLSSVCSVGVVALGDENMSGYFHILIQSERNHYKWE